MRHKTIHYITEYRDQYMVNGLTFTPLFNTGVIFSFLFFATHSFVTIFHVMFLNILLIIQTEYGEEEFISKL
jgi:lipoprotein signal peptidase